MNIIKIAKVNLVQNICSKFNESFHISDVRVWPRQTIIKTFIILRIAHSMYIP